MSNAFHPTIEWMQEKYDWANKNFFDEELPECNFKIERTRKHNFGYFTCNERYWVDDENHIYIGFPIPEYGTYIDEYNVYEDLQPVIGLNSAYFLTEEETLNVLIHEMCHYYTYKDGYMPTQGHGSEFRKIGNLVKIRSNGRFNIERFSHAEFVENPDVKKFRKSKEDTYKYYIIIMEDGNIRLTRMSDHVINKIINIEKWPKFKTSLHGAWSVCYKITNQEIVKSLIDLGYSEHSVSFRYWEVSENTNLYPIMQKTLIDPYNYDVMYEKK